MSQPLPKLFVIGSSATLLFGPYLKEMVKGFYEYSRQGEEPSELKKAFDDLDNPQGASGGNSSMVLDYLCVLDQTDSFDPDVVLLQVGYHDIKRNTETNTNAVSLDQYRQNVEAIVAWFKKKKINLVWIANGPIDEKLHNAKKKDFHRYEADLNAYNEAAEAIINRNEVSILDLRAFMKSLGPMDQLLKDHIHCKDEVVKLQAAYIAGYVVGISK